MEPGRRIGTLIGGRYRLGSVLGVGAMGVVYVAEHEALQRTCAVKILNRELADDPRIAERFHREARAASRIQHPNIVYISDFGRTEDGSFFLVMEYSAGVTVRAELDAVGRLDALRALPILLQTADALDCAHRAGVVHRDLKPENLLLTEHRGRKDFVKVLDFGVAKLVDAVPEAGAALTGQGELYGTPTYMSPEQIRGLTVTPRADLYALGAVAYELVTGAPPFTGSLIELMLAHTRQRPVPPSERCPEARLSPAFDAVVGRCLAKSPDERYGSAAEVKGALQRLLNVLSGKGAPTPAREETEASTAFRFHAGLGGPGGDEPTIAHLHAHAPVTPQPSAGAEKLQRVVRELAEALRDHGLGSPELSLTLARLSQAEERAIGEQTELAVARALLEEIDVAIDGREARLRYAMIQLTQERRRGDVDFATAGTLAAATPGSPGRSETDLDLEAQLAELERRMGELTVERRSRVAALEPRLDHHAAELARWSEEVRAYEDALLRLVLAARPRVAVPELEPLYRQIDLLRAETT